MSRRGLRIIPFVWSRPYVNCGIRQNCCASRHSPSRPARLPPKRSRTILIGLRSSSGRRSAAVLGNHLAEAIRRPSRSPTQPHAIRTHHAELRPGSLTGRYPCSRDNRSPDRRSCRAGLFAPPPLRRRKFLQRRDRPTPCRPRPPWWARRWRSAPKWARRCSARP